VARQEANESFSWLRQDQFELRHDPLTSRDCSGRARRLLDPAHEIDHYWLLADGRLWLHHVDVHYSSQPQEYCIEAFVEDGVPQKLRVGRKSS
jgi:hypothetical protein